MFQFYVLDIHNVCVYMQKSIGEMGYSCLGFRNSTDLELGYWVQFAVPLWIVLPKI